MIVDWFYFFWIVDIDRDERGYVWIIWFSCVDNSVGIGFSIFGLNVIEY